MAGNQTDNLMLLDLTTGLPRTNETGGTPDILQISVDFQLISGANMLIDGDLVVNGTTTTVHSEQVNFRDNHLYLNADYTTVVAQTGGLVINVLPTATATTVAAGGFTAGVAAVSNPTVITAAAATFAVGDIIQIAGSNNQSNDGIFEVLSHVGTTLTIRGVGVSGATVPWVMNQFTADTTSGGDIRIVTVNVLEGDSSGNWSTATVTNTTGIVYNTFTTQGLVDLQEAYEQGNTITTSAGEGNLTINGTENFVVGGSVDVDFNTTGGISFDADLASNFTVDGNSLDITTTTSGNLTVSAAEDLILAGATSVTANSSGGGISIGNLANAFPINIGTGAADRVITMGNATGATSVNLDSGTGGYTFDSTVPETTALMTWTTTGASGDSVQMFVGDSNPSGAVAGLAGSLFFRDTGTGAELYLNTSAGSGTTWTAISTAAGATLQTAYVAGNTITTSAGEGNVTINGTEDFIVGGSVDVDFDTTGGIQLDADGSSNFTVDSNDLTLSTTSSGSLTLTSASNIPIGFATNLAAGIAISDGIDNFMTFDSTTGNKTVAVNRFLDVTGMGAGITLTAAVAIAVGDVVSLNSAGNVILADSNTGTDTDAYVIGVALTAALAAAPVRVFTVSGDLVPVAFSVAPGGATNGSMVFLSATSGRATITAPTGSGNVIYKIGILQGADGADTTPLVLYQPQFLAKRP